MSGRCYSGSPRSRNEILVIKGSAGSRHRQGITLLSGVCTETLGGLGHQLNNFFQFLKLHFSSQEGLRSGPLVPERNSFNLASVFARRGQSGAGWGRASAEQERVLVLTGGPCRCVAGLVHVPADTAAGPGQKSYQDLGETPGGTRRRRARAPRPRRRPRASGPALVQADAQCRPHSFPCGAAPMAPGPGVSACKGRCAENTHRRATESSFTPRRTHGLGPGGLRRRQLPAVTPGQTCAPEAPERGQGRIGAKQAGGRQLWARVCSTRSPPWSRPLPLFTEGTGQAVNPPTGHGWERQSPDLVQIFWPMVTLGRSPPPPDTCLPLCPSAKSTLMEDQCRRRLSN